MTRTTRTASATLLAVALLPLTAPPVARAETDVYTEPGVHESHGRRWRTQCEPYSRTERCRTEIWATTIVYEDGRFTERAGWTFNNLTYRPAPRSLWQDNPMAQPGTWTADDGRRWLTECDTAATGGNGCRGFAEAKVIRPETDEAGRQTFSWVTVWVFNHIVRFGTFHPLPTPTPDPTPTPTPTPGQLLVPSGDGTVVASGLVLPWSLVFVDGQPVFSQRGGTLSTVVDGEVRRIDDVTGVDAEAEGGLLGLAVSEDFPDTLFAYYTSATDNRVVRMPLTREGDSFELGPQTVVVDKIPKARGHNGGRIAFGPDGMLYVATGDAGTKENAQDLDSLSGKILRVHPDGRIPADNPFGNAVWSYGHRNVQGLTWGGGRMWASEFGDDTWDELNVIVPGANYGWPEAEGPSDNPAFRNPEVVWRPTEASPSGLLWRAGNLYMSSLRGQRVWAMLDRDPDGTRTSVLEGDLGRIRDVVEGPGGTLWVLTSNGVNDSIVSYPLRPR